MIISALKAHRVLVRGGIIDSRQKQVLMHKKYASKQLKKAGRLCRLSRARLLWWFWSKI